MVITNGSSPKHISGSEVPANSTCSKFLFFSDASFDKNSKTGVGGFLCLSRGNLNSASPSLSSFHSSEKLDLSVPSIMTKTFTCKSCVEAELNTVIWLMQLIVAEKLSEASHAASIEVTIYTDSQSVAQLLTRRSKLESLQFQSKRSKKQLTYASSYRLFFTLVDQVRPNIIWVPGHQPVKSRQPINEFFSLIDCATRAALRNNLK